MMAGLSQRLMRLRLRLVRQAWGTEGTETAPRSSRFLQGRI
jgi:hypothetical protein